MPVRALHLKWKQILVSVERGTHSLSLWPVFHPKCLLSDSMNNLRYYYFLPTTGWDAN